MESQESIDRKYLILEKKGFGSTANAFLIKYQNIEKIYSDKELKYPGVLFD